MISSTQSAISQKNYHPKRGCNCKPDKNLDGTPENISRQARKEILVPADVDVESLLARLQPAPSPALKKNLTARIYYFLSLITTTNDNYKLTHEGYHRVCSALLKKIIDNRHYTTILELLSDPDDPVIESNNSYHSSSPRKNNGECKGYRLTAKYHTGHTKTFKLPDNLRARIRKHSKKKKQPLPFDYTFLTDQFRKQNISISTDVYEYIQSVGLNLLDRVEEENEYQSLMIYNLIGRWQYFVEKIIMGKIWNIVSSNNYRLNSNITNLPRELRPFLRVNGEKLGMIDVSSSQPYILSSMMKVNFFNDSISGYNLYTIYPELYHMLIKEGYVRQNVSYSSGSTLNYSSTVSGATYSILYKEGSSHTSPPFMWCHFSDKEIESMKDYQLAPFENDFYISLLESYTEETGEVLDQPEGIRQKLKDNMMFVLFDENHSHRNNNPYIQMFGAVYPGVHKWIEEIHRVIGKSQFAYLLQRCESYLMLNVAARVFHEKNPEAPIFSIHDALLTYDKYLPEIAGIVQDQFKRIIGTGVGVKIKTLPDDPRIDLVDVEDIWKEIQPIKTEKKFELVARSVMKSNVEVGQKRMMNC